MEEQLILQLLLNCLPTENVSLKSLQRLLTDVHNEMWEYSSMFFAKSNVWVLGNFYFCAFNLIHKQQLQGSYGYCWQSFHVSFLQETWKCNSNQQTNRWKFL